MIWGWIALIAYVSVGLGVPMASWILHASEALDARRKPDNFFSIKVIVLIFVWAFGLYITYQEDIKNHPTRRRDHVSQGTS